MQSTELVMADSFSYCAELVRNADRDRFAATLFASAQHRNALYALYAFDSEVGRVRDIAREAMPGEIRLQWWREVLQGQRSGEAKASPVAAAILNTIEIYHLPLGEMLDRFGMAKGLSRSGRNEILVVPHSTYEEDQFLSDLAPRARFESFIRECTGIARATGLTTSYRRCSAPRSRFRCSAAARRSASGSTSCWWT